MKAIRTDGFKSDYRKLPERLKQRTDRALAFLLQNLRHPSLQAKKMGGQRDPEGRDIWEVRVTEGYRFTFVIEGDTYILSSCRTATRRSPSGSLTPLWPVPS